MPKILRVRAAQDEKDESKRHYKSFPIVSNQSENHNLLHKAESLTQYPTNQFFCYIEPACSKLPSGLKVVPHFTLRVLP
jgi:hypothetical protein